MGKMKWRFLLARIATLPLTPRRKNPCVQGGRLSPFDERCRLLRSYKGHNFSYKAHIFPYEAHNFSFAEPAFAHCGLPGGYACFVGWLLGMEGLLFTKVGG